MKSILCSLLFLVFTGQCFADVSYTDVKKPIIVGRSAHSFTIELKANPTTGYMWFLKNFNGELLNIEARYYQPPKDDRVGAAGKDIWKFTITSDALKAPQITELHFIYAKPWDLSDQKSQTFTVLTTDQ